MSLVTLTGLSGTSIAVEATRVAAIYDTPADRLPAGVPAGQQVLFADGTLIGVAGAFAAIATALAAGGWEPVSLTNLDGDAVAVNPALVGSLAAVPADRLPTGIPAGTTISWGGNVGEGVVLNIAGTVAAVTALLVAGGNASAQGELLARVTGATGVAVYERGVATAQTGPGVYTVTTDTPITASAIIVATSLDNAAPVISATVALGPPSVITVRTTTDAGIATDADFSIRIIP